MARSLGVTCKKEEILLAVAEDGELLDDPSHEKYTAPALLEETERLEATVADFERTLREIGPDVVRILLPEQTYQDSYMRIAPRVTLETLIRLACVKANVDVEMLHRNSARARLRIFQGQPRGPPQDGHRASGEVLEQWPQPRRRRGAC